MFVEDLNESDPVPQDTVGLYDLPDEENKELVHAASVVCMIKFGRHYRVPGWSDDEYCDAAEMVAAEISQAVGHRLPCCADEIIPLMVDVFGKKTYMGSEDPLYGFAEKYLTDKPCSDC